MTQPPEVVVVAYGPVQMLRTALEGMSGAFDVLVVDNGLSDEAAALCSEHNAQYVRPPRNVGFAAAVNIGLGLVRERRDVLLLNPDARITPEGVLRMQAHLHASDGRGAVAPILLRPDGSREATTWPFPTPWSPWLGVLGLRQRRRRGGFFLSGAVLLLSGSALARVGDFDERFFLYAEETDWQKRAVQAGFTLHLADDVQAHHVGAGTSSDPAWRDAHFHGSAELYIRKWYGRSGWVAFRTGSMLAALRRLLTSRSAAARQTARRTVRAYAHGPAGSLPPRPGR